MAVVYLILLCAAYFSSRMVIAESDAAVGSIFVFVIALFSLAALIKSIGVKRGLFIYAVLGLIAVIIEGFALRTGFPYGNFVYTGPAGWKIFDLVPVTVPFAWTSIVLGAYSLGKNIPKTVAFMVLADLVLDPVSVSLGLWHWDSPGFYYGIPLVNYAGWVLSGFIGALVLSIFFRNCTKIEPTHGLTQSLEFLLVYWVCIAILQSLWIPSLIGIALLIHIWIWRKKQRS